MYTKLDRLRNRRIDNSVKLASRLNEAWDRIQNSEPVSFALGAMQPIDPDYTKKSFEEADRVANQLTNGLSQNLGFEYQGSTTNDTHIKAASDIDLLAILGHIFLVEPPLQIAPEVTYRGSAKQDLATLKHDATQLLRLKFPQASVKPGSKSIAVEGGSLSRKVDVVPSIWRDTVEWERTRDKTYRAIGILNSDTDSLIMNKPFYHNHQLHVKDLAVRGSMRKAIRLMKSLKFDADKPVNLSSYHICGIAYNMPNDHLTVAPGHDLLILERTRYWCELLRDNQAYRDQLVMPNGTESVFGTTGATLDHLKQMIAELIGLERDIMTDNRRSFIKLSEARYELPMAPAFIR